MKSYIRYIFLLLLFSDIVAEFKLGLENISQEMMQLLQKNRVGLITNQTGVTQSGISTLEVLQSHGIDARYLFVPEHGLKGVVAAGKTVENRDDFVVPVVSLYRHGVGISIAQEHLNEIDVLIFDIQDSGMRHYTYISTMYKTLQIAAEKNKKFVVFDRPNPLGSRVEGPIVKKEFESFISIAPIPLRHGMTVAELAHYYNTNLFTTKADLHIVPMKNYNKDAHKFTLLASLSPNIQSEQSVYGYSFLGLLGEIKPFDVGVGTENAFRSLLISKDIEIPLRIWKELHGLFKVHGINATFVSHYISKQNKPTSGFLLSFSQINQSASFNLFIAIVDLFTRSGIELSYAPVFDKSVGTDKIRLALQQNSAIDQLHIMIQTELELFQQSAQMSLMY